MVERIEKKEYFEYWQVETANEAHKDRRDGEESPQDQYKNPFETTDWKLFFDKSRLWNKNIQVLRDEISQIVFQKINLKTDPSLLRLDIHLDGGTVLSPAFVSITRGESLKFKTLLPGQTIPVENLIKDKTLHVMVPTNPQQFLEEEKKLQQRQRQIPRVALSEDTTTVIKSRVNGPPVNAFSLRDARTGRLRLDVLTLYLVTFVLALMLVTGIVWLVR